MSRLSKVADAALDGTVSTLIFVGFNGAVYVADPDLAPYSIGLTSVVYAIHMLSVLFAAIVGGVWGDFDDEEDRRELVGDLMQPGRREERHARKKGQGKNWWDF